MRFERLLPGQHFGLSFRTNASDESETRGKIDLERQRKERMRLILKKKQLRPLARDALIQSRLATLCEKRSRDRRLTGN